MFVQDFTESHGHPPTVREVADGVGLASPGGAHKHLLLLVADGRLVKRALTTNRIGFAPGEAR